MINMMEFDEFNNFNDAQNFILENIHDYDELFLVVDTPDVFFCFLRRRRCIGTFNTGFSQLRIGFV